MMLFYKFIEALTSQIGYHGRRACICEMTKTYWFDKLGLWASLKIIDRIVK